MADVTGAGAPAGDGAGAGSSDTSAARGSVDDPGGSRAARDGGAALFGGPHGDGDTAPAAHDHFVIQVATTNNGQHTVDDDGGGDPTPFDDTSGGGATLGLPLLLYAKQVSVELPVAALHRIPYLRSRTENGGPLSRRSFLRLNLPSVKFLDAFVEVLQHYASDAGASRSGSHGLDLRPRNQFQLYSVAAMLQLDHLLLECEAYIAANLTTATFLFTVQHAVKLKRPALLRAAYVWLKRTGGLSHPASRHPLLVDVDKKALVHAKNSLPVAVFRDLAEADHEARMPFFMPAAIDPGAGEGETAAGTTTTSPDSSDGAGKGAAGSKPHRPTELQAVTTTNGVRKQWTAGVPDDDEATPGWGSDDDDDDGGGGGGGRPREKPVLEQGAGDGSAPQPPKAGDPTPAAGSSAGADVPAAGAGAGAGATGGGGGGGGGGPADAGAESGAESDAAPGSEGVEPPSVASPPPVTPLRAGAFTDDTMPSSRMLRAGSWGHSPSRLMLQPGWREEVGTVMPEPYDYAHGDRVKGFAGTIRCVVTRHRDGLEARNLPDGWQEWQWELADILGIQPDDQCASGAFITPFAASRPGWWQETFGTEPTTWYEMRRERDGGLVMVAVDQHYLGYTECNLIGTTFSVYDHGVGSETPGVGPRLGLALPEAARTCAATITYDTNVLGRVPNSLRTTLDSHSPPVHLRSRQAVWSEDAEAWTMDFRSRARLASKKNFQLVQPGTEHDANPTVYLLFGKLRKDVHTLDYRAPLSAATAFAIALTTFANKFVCA